MFGCPKFADSFGYLASFKENAKLPTYGRRHYFLLPIKSWSLLIVLKLRLPRTNSNLISSIFPKSDREPGTVPFWNVVVKGTNGNAIMVDKLDLSSLTKLILLQRTD